MVKKMYQNPSGGLNEAGRKYFKRTEGSNLKAPPLLNETVSVGAFVGIRAPQTDCHHVGA